MHQVSLSFTKPKKAHVCLDLRSLNGGLILMFALEEQKPHRAAAILKAPVKIHTVGSSQPRVGKQRYQMTLFTTLQRAEKGR